LAVPRALGPVFMVCELVLVFGGTKGAPSHFHVLCSRTRFRRYRGRRVPFSSFALPDSYSTVPRASGPVFMFCAPGLVFGSTEGVESVFVFCTPGLYFGGTEGDGSRFHVLRAQIHFRRYRVRRVTLSCFACLDSFSVVPRASCPVFMFCPPGLVFGGCEGVESRFHVLRPRTHFRRYRASRVPISSFVLPDSFSAVPSVSVTVLMFYAPELVFSGTVDVRSRFPVFFTP
jgi:hypothetical protein